MALNGISDYLSSASFWVGFFWLPLIFFLLLSRDIDTLDEQKLFRFCKNGIFLISIYGIFLFVVKQWSGFFIEIPCLTTNLGDLGRLGEKCINRGSVFKLISTYNNGNIYGVCLLMFLPLYCFLENQFWKRVIVKCALLLTFSRTVWIGLLFHELCFQWIFAKHKKTILLALFATLISLTLLCYYYGFSKNFLFDLTFGGRLDSFTLFIRTGFFSSNPFFGIHEVIYAGVLHAFGWVGLFFFAMALVGPLVYQLLSRKTHPIHQCIGIGLFNYLLISFSDGALLLTPTLAFFWFLSSLLHRNSFANSMDMTSASSPK
jgi:hypothetical protein